MFKKIGLAIFIYGVFVIFNMLVYSYLEHKVSIPITMTIEQRHQMDDDSDDDVFVTLKHSKEWQEGPDEYGIQYDAVIHNNTSQNITNWYADIKLPKEARLSDSWNIEYALNDNIMRVSSVEHNVDVLANDIQTFGFIIISSEVREIEEITFTFQPVYQMRDYKLYWFNVLLSIALGVILLSSIVVETRLAPLKRESDEDKIIILQTMQTFSNFIDTKDPSTKGHSMRVAYYSKELAKKLKLPERDVELIYYIALLHDIGKIYIPDEILNKPGKLTPDERAIIETHAAKGAEILKDFSAIEGIAEGARYHHEHYDGTGYPIGLAGENIPFLARIICVADSYDAMSSDRCYRPRLTKDKIIEELKNNSGTQFDPEVVECMLELLDSNEFYTGMLKDSSKDPEEEEG